MAKFPYSTSQWRRVQKLVLARDGYECRIRLAGCLGHANSADHIVPVAHGGALFDPLNLRAACIPCNSRRGARTKRNDPGTDMPGRAPSRRW